MSADRRRSRLPDRPLPGDEQGSEMISSHVTSEGLVVYARTADGRLQVWLVGDGRSTSRLR
jgi:hypothetical protein